MAFLSQKILSLLLSAAGVLAVSYIQTDSYTGSGFLNGFSFQAIADPTHGRVYGVSDKFSSRSVPH